MQYYKQMKKYLIYIPVLLGIIFTSCGYDNYDEPDSFLTGTITYDGSAVGVKGAQNQLEIWQDGHALSKKIEVYIAHDGTFSASLFSGEYKIVRLGGAPWLNESTDTIKVSVNGTKNINVPVTPYFNIEDVTYAKEGDQLSVTFTINKVVEDAELENVYLYLGKNYLINDVDKDFAMMIDIANITLGEPKTITATVPDNLKGYNFFHARVGVDSNKSDRYIFSSSTKIAN